MTSTSAPTCDLPRSTPRFAVAGEFLDALGASQLDRLGSMVAPGAPFQALVPGGLREWEGPDGVVTGFTRWFGDTVEFQLIEAAVGEVSGLLHLHWRARLMAERLGEGWFTVEQEVYADTDDDGRFTKLRLLCSGYRPEEG